MGGAGVEVALAGVAGVGLGRGKIYYIMSEAFTRGISWEGFKRRQKHSRRPLKQWHDIYRVRDKIGYFPPPDVGLILHGAGEGDGGPQLRVLSVTLTGVGAPICRALDVFCC